MYNLPLTLLLLGDLVPTERSEALSTCTWWAPAAVSAVRRGIAAFHAPSSPIRCGLGSGHECLFGMRLAITSSGAFALSSPVARRDPRSRSIYINQNDGAPTGARSVGSGTERCTRRAARSRLVSCAREMEELGAVGARRSQAAPLSTDAPCVLVGGSCLDLRTSRTVRPWRWARSRSAARHATRSGIRDPVHI